MKTKLVSITPEMAQKWLNTKNTHNRKIYEKTVLAYAREMSHGMWKLNHQGIAFSEDGTLIDGQHRLMAIVYSGKTIETFVTWGFPIEAQLTVDTGKSRGVGDQLFLFYEETHANLKAAIVRGLIKNVSSAVEKVMAGTVKAILDIYRNEIDDVINHSDGIPRLRYAPALSAFTYGMKVFNHEIIEFEEKYFSGENLSQGDPALIFRNYMFNRGQGAGAGQHRTVVQNAAFTCMKSYIEKKPMKRLVISTTASSFFLEKQKKYILMIQDLLKY